MKNKIKSKNKKDSIDHIIEFVELVLEKQKTSREMLDELNDKELLRTEFSYIRQVSLGTLERYLYLNEIVNMLSRKKPKKNLGYLLVSALYEIIFMKNNADHITVNRYVEKSKIRYKHSDKFVNWFLREFIRKKEEILSSKKLLENKFKYSVSDLVFQKVKKSLGLEKTLKFFEKSLEKPPLIARVNQKHFTIEELKSELEGENYKVSKCEFSDSSLQIDEISDKKINETSAYKMGMFYIQDRASISLLDSIEIKKDDKVLDICAAPGGKTLYIAERLADGNKITANDISKAKLKTLAQNANRMKLDINLTNFDAREIRLEFLDKFSLVIADLPCSALGKLRRYPELKYKDLEDEFKSLSLIQERILNNAAKYTAVGGRLVYSTCTVNIDENEEIIKKFIKNRPDFELVECEIKSDYKNSKYGITLTGENALTDGFFLAFLLRKGAK